MGSSPNHPFFIRVINNLVGYAKNWRLPYLTVMLSTGPLFLSIMWKEYLMSGPASDSRIAILPEQWYRLFVLRSSWTSRYNTKNTLIFSSFGGSSWHRGDANFIFWVGQFYDLGWSCFQAGEHIPLLVVCGVVFAALCFIGIWVIAEGVSYRNYSFSFLCISAYNYNLTSRPKETAVSPAIKAPSRIADLER